ncbi:hypothetical protein EC844_13027 [Acinetobacter calcoaceticus]|uniref:Uncharacterized protein n=1 Tax=Acinetobacter calcoaceticus TaxID=471 RepID=A0A4R1XD28_ACICA|nr:hypothetical protein EC844_13027 [Acinetobacter calcoaceticus]
MISLAESARTIYFNFELGVSTQRMYKLHFNQTDILKFVKINAALKIVLKNQDDLFIKDFFNYAYQSRLVIETVSMTYYILELGRISDAGDFREAKFCAINEYYSDLKKLSTQVYPIMAWLTGSIIGIGGSQRLSMMKVIA